MPATDTAAILQTAVELRDAGCTVVPTRKDGGKAPAGRWKEYQDNPPTGQQLAEWFGIQGHTGIGIICGKASRNVEMAELEARAIDRLTDIENLADQSGLRELFDRITVGWSEWTPTGGMHWYYRITDGIVPGNTKLATAPNGLVLAETRGEGGFSVVAPSHGNVHPTGEPWLIAHGGPATMAEITWQQRDAFLSLLRSLDTPAKTAEPAVVHTPASHDGLRPGDHYNQDADWADILTGWTKIYTDNAGVTYWRRPGKKDGISATTGRNDGDNLYVFSTSTQFDTETAYTKFAAYTLLNFAGDYNAAARKLAEDGYGERTAPTSPLQPLTALQAPQPVAGDQDEESSWKPVDIAAHLDGTHIQILPSLLRREDGIALLYKGKIHSVYGESESGKSWLAQYAATQVIAAGGHVVYIDFEADAADVLERLLKMGADRQQLAGLLTYIKPEAAPAPDDPQWLALLAKPAELVVIDGVTEALNLWGGATKDNDNITMWTRQFPKRVAKHTGAAVVTIDHVAKDKETRGRFAIGGQAKLAAVDGAAYLVEPVDVMAEGKIGRLSVRITKDRHSGVRKYAGQWRKTDRTQPIADAVFDSTDGRTVKAMLLEPRDAEQVNHDKDHAAKLSIVQTCAGAGPSGISMTQLMKKAEGRSTDRMKELTAELVDDGYLTVVESGDGRGTKTYKFRSWASLSGVEL